MVHSNREPVRRVDFNRGSSIGIQALRSIVVRSLQGGRKLLREKSRMGMIRSVTLVVLVAMLSQLFLGGPIRQASAHLLPVSVAPPSAPPEPYLIGQSTSFTGPILGAFSSIGTALTNLYAKTQMPAGLAIPNPPSITDKVSNGLGLALAFIKPAANTANPLPPPAPPAGTTTFDFDGDGKADIGRWHSANTEFKVWSGSSYTTTTIGSTSSIPAPADFDSDGITDVATFNAGTWNIKKSSDGSLVTISGFGQAEDIPLPGDWVGDATIDEAVYRSSNGTWYFRDGANGNTSSSAFGTSGDIPVAGNFDGDSKMDMAVYRPSDGDWYINQSASGYTSFHWGIASDVPFAMDFDGDGISDPSVFRPSSGTWYILNSDGGTSTKWSTYQTFAWGNYGDQPVPADYDGDGKADFAIWRPSTCAWYVMKSSDSSWFGAVLGVPGDRAIPSSFIRQVGSQLSGSEMAKLRLSPKNATGGTDLYSQNFSWGTSLVGLPGRSGLDAGFGIGYNSLVWIKDTTNNAVIFDPDIGNPTPGFRFGFPDIEPAYVSTDTSAWAYMMVTPSGARKEFRQTAVSNVYETADSSYTQLVTNGASNPNDPVENISITVTTTDGTQMTYEWKQFAYRCTKILDRNGNYITITYDSNANLSTVTDTLGRVITVNYGGTTLPQSITQTWKDSNGSGSDVTHTWATFSYTTKTVATDFSVTVVGPPNDTAVNVLDKITYPDGSSTKFDYNGYLQVYKISNIAADSSAHVLNYVSTNLDSPSSGQPDCPKFTATSTWAENFNVVGGSAQPVTSTNTVPASSSFTGPNGSEATSMVKVGITGDPDNHYSRIHFGPSGYKEGLPIATEDCTDTGSTCGTRVRWTWNSFTQDNTSLSYLLNPRVVETRVGDGVNIKRTTIDYGSNAFGLPELIKVYDTDLSTVLKTRKSSYNLGSSYTDRHIIGLPSETNLYEGTDTGGTLMSKVTYAYDENGYTGTGQALTSPKQHDDDNYGTGFNYRGNLTKATRWDVTVPTTESASVYSSIVYNTAGSPISQTDALSHTVTMTYADNFNSSPGFSTFAYPTTITDPAGNSSTIQYRYDIGANIEATSPPRSGSAPEGKTVKTYDDIGRLERSAFWNFESNSWQEHSYDRYEYPANGIQSKTYSTIIDTDNDGADADDEVLSESWFDGTGRVRGSRTKHPGSTGGWKATRTEYDIYGRVSRQSVPTEVSVASPYDPDHWTVSGDDATQGWLWTYQKYDWKGRVVRKINTDGIDSTSLNDTDILISYDGCGCAGGQVTTIQGELVPRTDGTTGSVRRTRKIFDDILGRTYKTETYNWDGTVYSTNVKTYNGRDQVTQSRQYAGSTSSSTYQDTTATFDGHGRLAAEHVPQQLDSTGNPTHSTYSYNSDDSISNVTDARGAVANYTYNSRGLVTQVSYSVPSGSGISVTPTVSLSYDNAGNRVSMTDGAGSMSYEYDQFSQLTAETRQFSDTLTDSTVPSGGFRLEYSYDIGGQLKSYKDPYGRQFDFGLDETGRPTSVSGTAYAGITNYSSNEQYRAFGALKQVTYGNQTSATMTYNNRLQPLSYRLNDSTQTLFGKDYYYTTTGNNDNDGLLKRSVHLDDTLSTDDQAKRDQLNNFDSQGRIKSSETGEEGLTPFGNYRNGPYQQSYTYDAFGNLASKNDRDFGYTYIGCTGCPRTIYYSETIVNNRTQVSSYSSSDGTSYGTNNHQYDSDGRLVNLDGDLAQFDAAGQMIFHDSPGTLPDDSYSFDGNGDLTKWVQSSSNAPFYYYLRSSIFKANVLELDSTGATFKEYVFSGNGSQMAYFKDDSVVWLHEEPSGKERYEVKQDRTVGARITYDPSGEPSTNGGYTGGAACPPATCSSPANSALAAITNRGFDGLSRLTAWRNAEWLQSNEFLFMALMREQVGWKETNPSRPNVPPRLLNPGESAPEPTGTTSVFHNMSWNTGMAEGDLSPVFAVSFDFLFLVQQHSLGNIGDPDNQAIYNGCAGKYLKGLGSNRVPNAGQSGQVLRTAKTAGISPTLLAVTWTGESGFGWFFDNIQTNNNDGTQGNVDVGPMQINYNTFHNWDSLYTKTARGQRYFDEVDVFGSDIIGNHFFNGSITANLEAGANILRSLGGSDREKAGSYRAGNGKFRKKAAGQAAFDTRAKLFDSLKAKYVGFFDCLKKGGFEY